MDIRAKLGAELMKQAREDTSRSYGAELFNKIITTPVMLLWSDGTSTASTLAQSFTTEEDYSRYQSYKQSGKAYPVRAEAPEGADEVLKTLCNGFTEVLERFVVKGA